MADQTNGSGEHANATNDLPGDRQLTGNRSNGASGMIRLIAISGTQRLESAPNLPTVAEQGYARFEAVTWWGVLAPAGTPPAIVEKINAALKQAIEQPKVKERLRVIDGVVEVTSPKVFEQYIVDEMAKYKKLLTPVAAAK